MTGTRLEPPVFICAYLGLRWQKIADWNPMDCEEYEAEIAEIAKQLHPNLNVETLGGMICDTFRASFGTRSFRQTPEECTEAARRILARAAS